MAGFKMFLASFALVLLVSMMTCAAQPFQFPGVPATFVFGDSGLDGGNNNFLPNCNITSNFLPYGSTYFHQGTGRFTDGRTLTDFIAQALGLPIPPPSLKPGENMQFGANFASAGSGLLDSTNSDSRVLPLTKQLDQFQNLVNVYRAEFGEEATQDVLGRSVFIISAGVNDISGNYLQQPTMAPADFEAMLVDEYHTTLRTLYNLGARKIITSGLPPVGCSPRARSMASVPNRSSQCLAPANTMTQSFNTQLANMINTLSLHLQDVTIIQLKPYQWMMRAINSPESFGFESSTDACCGSGPFNAGSFCYELFKDPSNVPQGANVCSDPSKFLFWDAAHPTEQAYYLQFQNYWYSQDKNVVAPVNLQTFFAANSVPYPPLHP